jgi:hypothetical protein
LRPSDGEAAAGVDPARRSRPSSVVEAAQACLHRWSPVPSLGEKEAACGLVGGRWEARWVEGMPALGEKEAVVGRESGGGGQGVGSGGI